MDWDGLMRVGFRELRLKPWEFWALTPAELSRMLGRDEGAAPMLRDRLNALALAFPDRADAEISEGD